MAKAKLSGQPDDAVGWVSDYTACGQTLHLGDVVKIRHARGTREETRKQGAVPRGFAARSRVLALLDSLAQIGKLARRLG